MKRYLAASLLIASSTAADVAPRPIVRDTAACRADSECVLTHFQGCCGGECCPTHPRAMASAELKRQQDRCAVIECASRGCPDVKCPAPEPDVNFRAVCRQGACVLDGVQTAECRSNDDCTVEYPSGPCSNAGPCGCCPSTEPRAVARSSVREEAPRPQAQPQPKPGDVKYGLSQGGATAPNCAPCPARRAATAMCSSGRCVLQPVMRPHPRPPG